LLSPSPSWNVQPPQWFLIYSSIPTFKRACTPKSVNFDDKHEKQRAVVTIVDALQDEVEPEREEKAAAIAKAKLSQLLKALVQYAQHILTN
jgi:hypothetical protein